MHTPRRLALALAVSALLPATATAAPRNLATCHIEVAAGGNGTSDCVGFLADTLVTRGGTASVRHTDAMRRGRLRLTASAHKLVTISDPADASIQVASRLHLVKVGHLVTVDGKGKAGGGAVKVAGAGTLMPDGTLTLDVVVTNP